MKSRNSKRTEVAGFVTLEAVIASCLAMTAAAGLLRSWRKQWELAECERAAFRRAHRQRMASDEAEVRALVLCGGGRRELLLRSLENHRFGDDG